MNAMPHAPRARCRSACATAPRPGRRAAGAAGRSRRTARCTASRRSLIELRAGPLAGSARNSAPFVRASRSSAALGPGASAHQAAAIRRAAARSLGVRTPSILAPRDVAELQLAPRAVDRGGEHRPVAFGERARGVRRGADERRAERAEARFVGPRAEHADGAGRVQRSPTGQPPSSQPSAAPPPPSRPRGGARGRGGARAPRPPRAPPPATAA